MARAPAREQPVPEGWIVKSQARKNGRVDKCYYNPSTGYKFYSRKAVFRHLASENSASPLPNKERSIVIYTGGDTNTSSNQRSSVDIKSKKNTRSSLDQLPDGWIQINKPRKASTEHRVKRDPYYVDPVSGYAFRSRMDAFRYIATGDISKCIIKPKKADASNLYATENEGRVPPEKENKGLIAKQPVAHVNRTPSCEAIRRKQIAKQSDAQANRTPSSGTIIAKQPDAQANRTPSSDAQAIKSEQIAKQPDAKAYSTPSSGAIKRRPTVQIGDSPEWLPSGWITEIKTQQSGQHAGYTYQCYFNPFTETRFYTKKKVLRYLESEELRRSSMNKETSTENNSAGDILTSSNQSGSIKNKEINTTTNSTGDILTSSTQTGSIDNKTVYSSDELPDGWVKEIRLRYSKSGVHKDPYYIDPVSEYAFRSRKDALRYLKSGDIKKCAIRPKKKHMINMYPLEKGQLSNKPLPVHKKGQGRQKHQDPVDSQKKRSVVQLCPRRTKSFKTIGLPIRSSKRLAVMKSNRVADSRKRERPEAMPKVELDFFEKHEAKEPSKVEETILTGDGTVKNQERSAINRPGQSLVRADNVVNSGTVTSKPEQNLLTSVEGSVGKSNVSKTVPTVDLGFSEKLKEVEKLKGAMTEQLLVTPVQDAVQSDRKSDVRETLPTVDEATMASKSEKLPVAKKPRKLTVTKRPKKLPVMPVQGTIQSGTKSEEAARTGNKGMMPSKPEKLLVTPAQGADQGDGKSDGRVLPTDDEGTMGSKPEKLPVTPVQGDGKSYGQVLHEGTMAGKSEKLPLMPVQDADQSSAKSVLEAVPTVNLDFFEKIVAEEHPEVGERKPFGDTPDSPLLLPFGDSWSDPCLEFAFKTLTGDIPVLEDTASIADYFQQQELVQSSSPVQEPPVNGGTLENGSQSGRKRKAGTSS